MQNLGGAISFVWSELVAIYETLLNAIGSVKKTVTRNAFGGTLAVTQNGLGPGVSLLP